MVNMHNYNIDLFYIIKQVLSPFLWNKAIPLWYMYNKGKVNFKVKIPELKFAKHKTAIVK